MESTKVKKTRTRKKSVLSKETNRKAAHNAVECRRKQKITQLLDQLSGLIEPGCHCGKETKVDVLLKVVDKIRELETQNTELATSIEEYCTDRESETEADLQEQLAMVMVDHISLLFNFLHHKSANEQETRRKRQTADVPNPAPTNERCGFGVADLLESYDRPTHSLLGRNIESDLSQDTRCSTWVPSHDESCNTQYSQGTTPITGNSNNYNHSESTRLLVPSSSNWHSYNHLPDNTWEHNRSFSSAIVTPHGLSSQLYYPDVEPHPQPHPSQYLHDPNRTSISNNVWRPYNDQQPSQQVCMSGQAVNTSFLMEQLLEKLL